VLAASSRAGARSRSFDAGRGRASEDVLASLAAAAPRPTSAQLFERRRRAFNRTSKKTCNINDEGRAVPTVWTPGRRVPTRRLVIIAGRWPAAEPGRTLSRRVHGCAATLRESNALRVPPREQKGPLRRANGWRHSPGIGKTRLWVGTPSGCRPKPGSACGPKLESHNPTGLGQGPSSARALSRTREGEGRDRSGPTTILEADLGQHGQSRLAMICFAQRASAEGS